MTRAVIGALCATLALLAASPSLAEQVVWRFDNLKRIGGFKVTPEGRPKVIRSPVGKAIQFDGKGDSVFVDGRPLVGAQTYTVEAVFRPEGGPFQQRFMHIAETDPITGQDALPSGTSDPNPRFMFEVRVVDGQWYLDAFTNSKAGQKALVDTKKLHPLNRWYAVAQTFDGKTYRAYVNGVLQAEGELSFAPHGPGHVRAGSRMNHVDYFTGSIAEGRFTDHALSPAELLHVKP
jgi:hypothetical protein